jgi:hypothetical protein
MPRIIFRYDFSTSSLDVPVTVTCGSATLGFYCAHTAVQAASAATAAICIARRSACE